MFLFNLAVNIILAILFVWLMLVILGAFAPSLPAVAVMLLKVLIVLVAAGWLFGFFGPRIGY